MNIAQFCISRKTLTVVLTLVTLGAGLLAYQRMGRLEDPEFTIKDALVITPYPGASAREVEQEVSDEIELAVQQLGQLKRVVSKSDRGLSTVTVSIQDKYGRDGLPQVWDEVRRKVSDAQKNLPPGAGPSMVIDDYGDVYGVFFVIYGAEYTYAELKRVADMLRRELLLVHDVAKIETYGELREAVYVELQRDRMAGLGIAPSEVTGQLRQKNIVADSGRVVVGDEFIAMDPTGAITSVAGFESILISASSDRQIYLRDIATVRRGYVDPPDCLIRYDGQPGIGLGISTVSGGNVVAMGEAIKKRAEELLGDIPLGIESGIVSLQSRAVTTAISGFVNSLLQAVAIVILVLLVFMGLRSGLIIGFVLVLTIMGSFIFLKPMGVMLERISLGALIIALGMLVDNAIVVVDGVLVRLKQGIPAARGAADVVAQTALPLLGATVIAILAFAAIGTSDDSTGEFCRSLFQVVAVSLLFSWLTAVTVTPLLCVLFLPTARPGESDTAFDSGFYTRYRRMLEVCLERRRAALAVVLVLFGAALWGFSCVEQSFFPPSTRPQFMVDVWLPQGTHIDETRRTVTEIDQYLRTLEAVTHTTAFIGQGGLRFLLTYTPEKQNSAYAQFLVDVEDAATIDTLIPRIDRHLHQHYPDALCYGAKFELGPGSTGKIRARFSGADPDVLRGIADQAEAIMQADPNARAVRTDWRQRVKLIRPIIAEEQASENGIQRPDVADALSYGFEGLRVGIYREGDLILPVIVRAPAGERDDVRNLEALQVWSRTAQKMIPLGQVTEGYETVFEDEIIMRRNRIRTITVFCDPHSGPASVLFERLRPAIERIPLPPGYVLEWGGEYEDSQNAQGPLFASLPLFFLIMVLVTVALFNSIRQPLVIWGCVPLAIIGVTVGLLITAQPFGFMALLGFLSLSGMLIKNAIVLIDQINAELESGAGPREAIVASGVSRLRPVAMAAATTALGMLPLLQDAFFVAMAVTIIFGLLFATTLTMVVVPVLYAIVYRVR